jgi:hypothetical protein
MTDNNIAYVDSLPALKKSVGQEYRSRHVPEQEWIASHRGGDFRALKAG